MAILEAHRSYLLIRSVIALVVVPIVFGAIFGVFVFVKAPWYLFGGLIVIFLLVMLLIIVQVIRLATFKEKVREIPGRPTGGYTNEQVVGEVYGIMAPFRRTSGVGVIGYGEMTHSENALIFTDRRVLAVMVPVEGAGVAMGGVDYSAAHHLLNKGGIEQKGRQMVANMTPQQILEFDQNNFDIDYSEIKKVKLRPFFNRGVVIWTTGGGKHSYTTTNAQHIDLMRDIFTRYVPGKVS